ncbi:hypothetical protein QVH35_10740 [Candidatus Nitrosotenuis chungbukensis]|uniref:hypothetical protein n=1 Tax=Candidatus Nitrosotenuis chungbukensis TaxID=1353246 RepID=UPI0005B2DC12|nr:hypothetical protein [Candidatus Nitrosotenuis chungbukensis]WKT57769.1 hypothetical protein QVH35_10740 [Candidatus Nitrosotenuis chungbukensis]
MQTGLDVATAKKYLILALVACASTNLISNFVGSDTAIFVGNVMYIPVAGTFLIVSMLMISRFGTSGNFGLAWISFGGYAISWFIAEMLWIVQELYLRVDPFPSSADIFYLVGYPFLLMFFIAYLQPVRLAITKKMFIAASSIAMGTLIPSVYLALEPSKSSDLLQHSLSVIYPIFDALILIPALLGVALFFKGQVNFTWTLMCLGAISVFVADTAFLFAQNEDSYYTGNPMEILFYWNYILLTFGVYGHMKLFQRSR